MALRRWSLRASLWTTAAPASGAVPPHEIASLPFAQLGLMFEMMPNGSIATSTNGGSGDQLGLQSTSVAGAHADFNTRFLHVGVGFALGT